jgi:DNA-binding CsgD family transcriptional regulator
MIDKDLLSKFKSISRRYRRGADVSERDNEMMRLFIAGKSIGEIAESLKMRPDYVSVRMTRLRKMNP